MRPIQRSGKCSRRQECAPNSIVLDATSGAVVVKPALIPRSFVTAVQICRRELRLAFYADPGRTSRSLRIPVVHLMAESPNVQAPAPRVFHLNRHDLAPRVIHLDGYTLAQALAPGVFHLNYDAPEHAPAARVFRLNRRDFAPRIFHLNHHAIRQVLAPDCFASELESG